MNASGVQAGAAFSLICREKTIMKANRIAIVSGVVLALLSDLAAAALPTEVTDAFTALNANVALLMPLVWGVFAAVTFGFILLKVTRKGANKAT
jgi:polyferredoxin